MPDLVHGMPRDVGDAFRKLEYNGIVCVLLALERVQHPDLVDHLPHTAQGPANRITYMSNYSPNMAPAGRSSFLCEVTVPGGAAFPGRDLEREIVDGLVHTGLVRQDEVLFDDRTEIRQAYVVFDHGYAQRRATALEWLESNGITPLGRFGRFEYDNSDQCVIKSRELATRLLKQARVGSKSD
jgi:protoporphyrinogen oxidase